MGLKETNLYFGPEGTDLYNYQIMKSVVGYSPIMSNARLLGFETCEYTIPEGIQTGQDIIRGYNPCRCRFIRQGLTTDKFPDMAANVTGKLFFLKDEDLPLIDNYLKLSQLPLSGFDLIDVEVLRGGERIQAMTHQCNVRNQGERVVPRNDLWHTANIYEMTTAFAAELRVRGLARGLQLNPVSR